MLYVDFFFIFKIQLIVINHTGNLNLFQFKMDSFFDRAQLALFETFLFLHC